MKSSLVFDPNKRRLFDDLNFAVYFPQTVRINDAREFKLEIDYLIEKIDDVLNT